jgi:hypothetical protein
MNKKNSEIMQSSTSNLISKRKPDLPEGPMTNLVSGNLDMSKFKVQIPKLGSKKPAHGAAGKKPYNFSQRRRSRSPRDFGANLTSPEAIKTLEPTKLPGRAEFSHNLRVSVSNSPFSSQAPTKSQLLHNKLDSS